MLEEACWKAGREASQGLFLSALEQRDDEVVALAGKESKGKVMHYLLYGSGLLRGKVAAKGVLVCGIGAMEKNVDAVICRRFKKQGMSWTTESVTNLIKLRTLGIIKSTGKHSGQNSQPVGWAFPPTNSTALSHRLAMKCRYSYPRLLRQSPSAPVSYALRWRHGGRVQLSRGEGKIMNLRCCWFSFEGESQLSNSGTLIGFPF